MLISYIALILRILSNPTANVIQKKLVVRNSAISVNFWVYLILSIFCLFITPFSSSIWNTFNLNFWLYVLFAGSLCTLGSVCLIKAFQYGELSILGPINSYKCIVGLIIGYILLGEKPSLFNLIGLLLIIFGSWFIFDTKNSDKKNHAIAIILRFCALFFTGCEAVILKKIILLSNPEICFLMWCYCGLLFSLVMLICFNSSKTFLERKQDYLSCLYIAIFLGIMQYSTNIVFKFFNVGLSLALFQLSGLVTVFFGWKIFKEKNIIQKTLGTIIMILGACFILLK